MTLGCIKITKLINQFLTSHKFYTGELFLIIYLSFTTDRIHDEAIN